MKGVIGFFLRIFGFWMSFFLLSRLAFFVLNFSGKQGVGFASFFKSQLYGLRLDLSMSGYIALGSGLLFAIGHLIKGETLGLRFVLGLNKFVLVVVGIFLAINARLYQYWSIHIDASIFDYLRTPKEAFASVSILDTLFTILITAGLLWLGMWLFKRFLEYKKSVPEFRPMYALYSLLMCAFLVVPIRGGFDVAVVGLSSAYFSQQPFENHTAINPVWNAMYSLAERGEIEFLEFMDQEEAERLHEELFGSTNDTLIGPKNMQEMNVVFLVLESFTANAISSIGGEDGVTPNLNVWMEKGLSFSNFYSSADRSDRGLTTLFTGFPALPVGKLLKYPDKLRSAPNFYRNLNKEGYHTSFYYGGNLEFANLKVLFTEGKVDDIVTGKDISGEHSTGKWGVRDADMFDLFLNNVQQQPQPFFSTLYTLSSHEPFDIPAVSLQIESKESKFLQAVYYTDSCFGDFMNRLSTSPLWENTIVVVTADHGVPAPEGVSISDPEKYRIPLLIAGGSIDSTIRYDHFASHCDLPYTLEQMLLGSRNGEYAYSKSVFDTTKSFAQYYYNMGVGMISEKGTLVYDIKAEDVLMNLVPNDSARRLMKQQMLGVTQKASAEFLEY